MKILDIPQSGKHGSAVAVPSRYGQLSRVMVAPVDPRTPAQLASRAILKRVTRRWRALQDPQRQAWNLAGTEVKSTPRLVQAGCLNGFLLFTKINCTLAHLGREPLDTPPARPAFAALAPTGLVITNTGGLTLKLTCPTDPGPHTLVRASLPHSPGRRSSRGKVKLLGWCPAPVQGAADITALYTARLGVPPAGTRLFVQVSQLIDGWEALSQEFSALVPEAA